MNAEVKKQEQTKRVQEQMKEFQEQPKSAQEQMKGFQEQTKSVQEQMAMDMANRAEEMKVVAMGAREMQSQRIVADKKARFSARLAGIQGLDG